MQYILLINLMVSMLTVWYSLSITILCRRLPHLKQSHYCLLAVNCISMGVLVNRITNNFLPYQNIQLTVLNISYYIIQLYAAIQAYWYFRHYNKETL